MSQRSGGPRDVELEAGRMPFLAHFRELRDRVRNAAIAFVIAFVGCWFVAERIFDWLCLPLFEAWRANATNVGPLPTLNFREVTEPFWVYMSVALWAGVFVASPIIFYQIWQFIAPGLYKKERRTGVGFAVFSALFFISGAGFCYRFALVPLYTFLLSYGTEQLHPMLAMKDYLEFTRNMMLAFGVVFEMPVLIYFLALVGMVTHRTLWKFNRWAIVLCFIIGAILTPSPDVVSQLFMALPMVALYNLSILAAYVVTRKREKRAARAAAAAGPADA